MPSKCASSWTNCGVRLLIGLLGCWLCSSVNASAQTATAGSKLTWDITAANLAEVQAFTWKYYPDTAAVGVTLTSVTCVAQATAGNFTCSVPFPAFTPGVPHTIKVAATNAAGEAPASDPLSFTFVLVPNKATNVRAQ